MSGETNMGRTVELYLRAEPQFGAENQKQAVIDRVVDLDREEKIEDHHVYIWGREIRPTGPLEGTDYHRTVLTSLREFEAWLERNDAAVDRLFKRREVDSEFVDATYTVISLPMVCLAVYDHGELAGVYPHYDGERTHTVREGLDELAAESSGATGGVRRDRPRQR